MIAHKLKSAKAYVGTLTIVAITSANTAIASAQETGGVAGSRNEIFDLIQTVINLLFGITSFVIIGMIIIGGIQYSTAGGNPQATSKAKEKITNAIFSLVVMIFLYPFLQWLVPGGIF